MADGTMTTFLASIGEVFTQAVIWVGDILTLITTEPALLVMVIAMPVIGFSVGLLGRLFNAR